jgi:hypothetical protein
MNALVSYLKLSLFTLAICVAALAVHYIWVGALPVDAVKLGATLGVLFVTGALIALISTPRTLTSEEQHARST